MYHPKRHGLPYKEAEEAEERVHETDIVGDPGDDGLLAVRTHRLHGWRLEHFSLQYCHSGGCTWWSQDSRRVSSHVNKLTWTRTHLPRQWVRKVTGLHCVRATCSEWIRRRGHKANSTGWTILQKRQKYLRRKCGDSDVVTRLITVFNAQILWE